MQKSVCKWEVWALTMPPQSAACHSATYVLSPHVSNAAVFANPHFLPSAALWHPLIPFLHFPYSLSPSMAFLFQTHTLTHMQTLLSNLSVSFSPPPSHLFSLSLYLFAPPLYLPSFQYASHWFFSLHAAHMLSSQCLQPGCSIDEGSIIGWAIQNCLPKIVSPSPSSHLWNRLHSASMNHALLHKLGL